MNIIYSTNMYLYLLVQQVEEPSAKHTTEKYYKAT